MNIAKLKNGLTAWVSGFAGDPGTRIKFRHLNQDEYDAIIAKFTEKSFNQKTGIITDVRNDPAYRRALACAVVADWDGFDEDGNPWPCTPDNIAWLMEVSTDFRAMVREIPLSLEKMLQAEREEQEKNSGR